MALDMSLDMTLEAFLSKAREMPLDGLLAKALALGVPLFLVHQLVSYLTSPLDIFPGPFVARFTNLWRLVDYARCTQIQSHQTLHKKHGAAVRIGPNIISLSDPALLKTVYSTRGDFLKGSFYEIGDAVANGQRMENVFSTRSNVFHSRYLRPYQKFFNMATLLKKEHLADKVVVSMCEQLEHRFVDKHGKAEAAPLADWIDYCAWDLDWELTFSEDPGFLKTGADVKGMIHTGARTMRYLGIVGQIPWLDRVLGKNPYCPIKFATFNDTAAYSFQKVMERVSSPDKEPRGDFLENFLEAKEEHPDIVTYNEVVSYLMMNVLAGADTTAIVEKAIVYNILSHPHVLERLRSELDAANLSFPPTFEETRDLEYLNVVIKEGMRIHPVLSGVLERVVPSAGLTLPDGRFIPAGTKVGINPWVTSRNKDVYGEDADVFRPERWLRYESESEDEFAARLKRMRDADFTFGSGNRVCVGKNLAEIELHKITSTLFSRYDIELDNTCKQWSPRWWWFTFINDINVKIQRRPGVEQLPSVRLGLVE